MGRVTSVPEIPLFLFGYYGFGNWGDELSLLATLKVLEDIERELSFSFSYRVLAGDPRFLPPLPEGVEVVKRREVFRLFQTLSWAKYVVVGGGSLLQDTTSFRSLAYYISLLSLARCFGGKILFFDCGLGPLRRRVSEYIVSSLLRRSSLFLARDEDTLLFLEKSSLSIPFSLSADPVFLLWRGETSRGDSSRIGVFLRKQALEREGVLLEALFRFKREGWDLEFVAFHRDEDWEVTERLAQSLRCPARCFFSPSEVFSYFLELSGVISMRLHPLIVATSLGVPWLAFRVDPKIISFGRHWGGENLLSLEELSPVELCQYWRKRLLLRGKTLALREVFLARALEGKKRLSEFLAKSLG
ncbi:MAG: polysaccharide pyruvyl transferase CsaB [Candidatus Caldatribacteriaceae bacterium]